MGREIRRVTPNWQHPKDARGEYIPMHDEDYETAAQEWITAFDQWRTGTHPDQQGKYGSTCRYFWEYDTPPDEASCRPKFESEPTWLQMYETVSEGTPVSPPFATAEELIDYLVEGGDLTNRRHWRTHEPTPGNGWRREAAEAFVHSGWAPSGITKVSSGGVEFLTARDSDKF